MKKPLKNVDTTRYDNFPVVVKFFFVLLTGAGVGLSIFYIFGLSFAGRTLLDTAYYYLLITCFLPFTFLLTPMFKGQQGIPWYDLVLAVLAFAGSLYLYTQAYDIASRGWFPVSTNNFIVALMIFFLVLEAGRRVGGLPFLIICLFFAFYPLFADKMPGVLFGAGYPFKSTIGYNVLTAEGLVGLPTMVLGDIVIGFLVFAAVMVASGAGKFFLNLSLALLGRFPGGPAKVAVMASAFFGSLSGSIFANVIGTGSFTIPAMKRVGYSPHYAGAIEACSSTGGVLMPPVMGAVAFVMATLLSMDYVTIMIAAAIPAILYYFGLLMQVDAYARRVGLKGLPREEIPRLKETLKEGWPFLSVFVFLVWGLLYMRWERLAPFYASALMVALSFARRATMLTPKRAVEMLATIGKLITSTMGLLLPIGFILAGLTVTGTAPAFTAKIVNLGGHNIVPILLLGIAVCYLLGMMGMLIAAYVFLAVTLAPAIIEVGHTNVLATHLFILYYSMLSAITPPVALASFLGAAIAGASPMKTAVQSMRLGIVIYFVPFFFLFRPALIMQGPIIQTVYLFLLAFLGIALIAAGIEGYLLWIGNLPWWSRGLLTVAGFLFAMPEFVTSVIGGVLAVLTLLALMLRKYRMEPSKTGIPLEGRSLSVD